MCNKGLWYIEKVKFCIPVKSDGLQDIIFIPQHWMTRSTCAKAINLNRDMQGSFSYLHGCSQLFLYFPVLFKGAGLLEFTIVAFILFQELRWMMSELQFIFSLVCLFSLWTENWSPSYIKKLILGCISMLITGKESNGHWLVLRAKWHDQKVSWFCASETSTKVLDNQHDFMHTHAHMINSLHLVLPLCLLRKIGHLPVFK